MNGPLLSLLVLPLLVFGASVSSAETVEVASALITVVESIEISASRPGELAEVFVTEGTILEPGQVVARLDSAEAALAVERAELEVKVAQRHASDEVEVLKAEKANELAKTDLARAEAANRRSANTVSAREVDRLRLAVDTTELDIAAAKEKLAIARLNHQLKAVACRMAEHNLKMHTTVSPASGMVVQLNKRAGEAVDAGESIAKIVRVDKIRAEGFVSAEVATRGLVGSRAALEVSVPGRGVLDVTGRVVFVSPEANAVSSQVRVWADFNRGKLPIRPGLRGKLKIELD